MFKIEIKQVGKYTETVTGTVCDLDDWLNTVPVLSKVFHDCKITFYEYTESDSKETKETNDE